MKLLIDLQGAQTESRFRGIGRQVREVAGNLINAAGMHDVEILLNAGLTEAFEEVRDDFFKILPRSSVKSFKIPGPVREMDLNNVWRMRASELYREAFIADLNPDVLYVSSLFEGVVDDAVTSIGLMQSSYPTAATLFDLIPLYDPQGYLGADFMRRFYYRRAQSLKRADRLVAISQSAKNEAVDMLQIPASRIDVALLAAESSFKKHDLSEEAVKQLLLRYGIPPSFILYVGAIEPRKNIPIIIQAFSQLTPDQRADTVLVFGGRLHESERVQLQTTAARFGLDPSRLLLPGYIAEEDLAPLYGLSRLFVFPSMQEGFGLPPLEAMACGTPVLVARNSSLPEVVGRDDQLFGTFDASELSEKMARILTDDNYAAELGDWGIKRAAQFSWPETGRRTLESLEQLHAAHAPSRPSKTILKSRPKLAFVSPLPSDRTGIAVFGSALLRELACYYDIECIIHGTTVTDHWITANFPLRNVSFLRENANLYQYVVYQFGNSVFHEHMFDLILEVPGVVILHDFYLSGILDYLGNIGERPLEHFIRQLYLTHGFEALLYAAQHGRHAAAERYPTNSIVFQNALGVIVHSQWSIDQAFDIYGPTVGDRIVRVPLLRAARGKGDKNQSRQRLGLAGADFVVSTFGFIAETKLGDRLVAAWSMSKAAQSGAKLVFVGDHPVGPWSAEFAKMVEASDGSITITGFADDLIYEDYLSASDMAVQLRQGSRGETSGAVLDCMATGLPVIVNDHGPFAELNDGIVLKISEDVVPRELADAIDRLFLDRSAREALGQAARDHIVRHHHPAAVGERVRDAIEDFTAHSSASRQGKLLTAISKLYAPVAPSQTDLCQVSEIVAASRTRVGRRRLFYDITLLAQGDAHTGIERVVRSILNQFLKNAPEGYHLEPVVFRDGQLHFARSYVARRFGIAADVLPDSPIDYDADDIYIMLEWAAEILPMMVSYLGDLRNSGVKVVIGIHDLLPLQMPQMFPDFVEKVSQNWFRSVLKVADQIVCFSRCVADDVVRFGQALKPTKSRPIAIDYFHIAADISESTPTLGIPVHAADFLERLKHTTSFIMVGTIEPRKGHQQVVDAFTLLWERNVDVNLTIVGRKGWSVDATIRSIEDSREYGHRLHWISDASDEYLERLYASSTALIAASEGEGFGLPLVEAASRGLPLFARDIPIFREVAGDHASYFKAESASELADAITRWITLFDTGQAPPSSGLKPLTWNESVTRFKDALFYKQSYAVIGG